MRPGRERIAAGEAVAVVTAAVVGMEAGEEDVAAVAVAMAGAEAAGDAIGGRDQDAD